MFWKPTVAIQADVASFILELSCGLKGYNCHIELDSNLTKTLLAGILNNKRNKIMNCYMFSEF